MDQKDEQKLTFDKGLQSQIYNWEESETPKIIEMVIRYSGGRIKDEQQATYILMGLVTFLFMIAVFFGFGARSKDTAEYKAPAGQRIIYPENSPPRLER